MLQYMAAKVLEIIINDMLRRLYNSKWCCCYYWTWTSKSSQSKLSNSNSTSDSDSDSSDSDLPRTRTDYFYSVIIWGIISLCWIAVVAQISMIWFNYTDHPYYSTEADFLDENDPTFTTLDAFWFSYISLLTVRFFNNKSSVYIICYCYFTLRYVTFQCFVMFMIIFLPFFLSNFF